MNELLPKTYNAGAAIAAHRFVVPGAADHAVIQAAAATHAIFGISDLGADAAGDRVDVHHVGIAKLEYGGTVTRGQLLTADSVGKGVTAAPSAGTTARHGALALVSGVDGDIVDVLIVLGQVTTPA